ncbi:hypothetical protein [Streptomyces sp. NPDC003952]
MYWIKCFEDSRGDFRFDVEAGSEPPDETAIGPFDSEVVAHDNQRRLHLVFHGTPVL